MRNVWSRIRHGRNERNDDDDDDGEDNGETEEVKDGISIFFINYSSASDSCVRSESRSLFWWNENLYAWNVEWIDRKRWVTVHEEKWNFFKLKMCSAFAHEQTKANIFIYQLEWRFTFLMTEISNWPSARERECESGTKNIEWHATVKWLIRWDWRPF